VTIRCTVVIPPALQSRIMAHLFPGDCEEHGLVIAAGVVNRGDALHLLARELFLARDGIDYIAGRKGYRMLKAEFIHPIIRHCRGERLAYIAVHNHGGTEHVAFSRDDLDSHERGYPALLDLNDGMPVGALVYAQRAVAGDIWLADGSRLKVDETRVPGVNIQRFYDSGSQRECDVPSYMHDRQVLMFGPQGQRLLQKALVGIIGAGGVGSLLVEYLARLGVGRLLIVDKDRVELSNLSRLSGSKRWDARYPFSLACMPPFVRNYSRHHSAWKVDTAKRSAHQANPDCQVETLASDFSFEHISLRFLACDFIFLAADSMRARLIFNAIVQQYYIPGIQAGSKIVSADRNTLVDAFSVERWVLPGENCLWCSGMISPSLLAMEAKSEVERREQRYGTEVANPSVITMNAIGASHAANDFLMSFLGLHNENVCPEPRRFKHLSREIIQEEYPPDASCTECSSQENSRFGRGDSVALPTVRDFDRIDTL
jgi:hypothetical protein